MQTGTMDDGRWAMDKAADLSTCRRPRPPSHACTPLHAGMMDEAADFYMQAKAIFDRCLGPSHPKTVAWQEDLFFLINAPAIQSMVKEAPCTLYPVPAIQSMGKEAACTLHPVPAIQSMVKEAALTLTLA